MDDRRLAGGAGVWPRMPGRGALAVALAVLAAAIWSGPWAGAEARQAQRAIDHHVTVLNGKIMGSAFMIGGDLALTNAHVVEGLRPGGVVALFTRRGGPAVHARLVGVSRRMDLAVLRTPENFLAPVSPQDVASRAGLKVRAAGVDASGGPGAGQRLELAGAVVVPQADLDAYGPGLVVRMPGVRPGFSGGPVLDAQGRLLGMIAAIRSSASAHAAAPASGYAPLRARPADEAYVLRAADIRREAARLVAAAGG